MSRLPDLEAWAVFATLAETGSFVRTAEELAVSKATVSKAIARLERRIGASLLNRTSRRVALTETGRRVAEGAARILAEGEALEAEALSQAVVRSGLVRISAPMSFGFAHLAPLLPDLFRAYPGISVDLQLSDEVADLVGGGFDLAVRIGFLADSALRARRVCEIRRFLVGAPAYFARHGRPAHPAELQRHQCLSYAYMPSPDRWRFTHVSGEEVTVAPRGMLRSNNGDAMRQVLLAGLALTIHPEFLVWEDLAVGRLEVAMSEWTMPPVPLHIVTPPGGHRPARVAAVIEFLAARLAAARWASGCPS